MADIPAMNAWENNACGFPTRETLLSTNVIHINNILFMLIIISVIAQLYYKKVHQDSMLVNVCL